MDSTIQYWMTHIVILIGRARTRTLRSQNPARSLLARRGARGRAPDQLPANVVPATYREQASLLTVQHTLALQELRYRASRLRRARCVVEACRSFCSCRCSARLLRLGQHETVQIYTCLYIVLSGVHSAACWCGRRHLCTQGFCFHKTSQPQKRL